MVNTPNIELIKHAIVRLEVDIERQLISADQYRRDDKRQAHHIAQADDLAIVTTWLRSIVGWSIDGCDTTCS